MQSFQFKDPNEIKIFILFLMSNVTRPLTFNELNDVVVQDELVSYFDFAECLEQLVDTNNVRIVAEEDEESPDFTYEITEQGRHVAKTLESKIMGFIRTKSLKSALRYLSFKDSGTRISVTSSPRPDDDRIDMTFLIKEKDSTAMELHLIADNSYQASQMSINFQNQPETVYRSILSLLAGDADYLLK